MSTQQLTTRVTAAGSGIGRASGFELTSPGQPGAANVEAALERNRAFAAAGGHHGAVVFPNLRLFVITCLDPRVDPAHFLGLGLSDAMVVRNVGGRVTPEVINDVAFIGQLAENALPDGPLFEVAVIHHTQCGTGALADDTFRRRYAQRIGVEESTLREHAVLDPARPSPATSNACAPHPRSPRASPSPGTSTTSSPAWCRRSSPPAAEEIEPFHNPNHPEETKHHDNHRCSQPQARARRKPQAANPCPRSGRYDPPRCLRPVTCGIRGWGSGPHPP